MLYMPIRLVSLPAADGVDLIDELWISAMDFIWIDSHDWTCEGNAFSKLFSSFCFASRLRTIFFMHCPNLMSIPPPFDEVKVKFVQVRHSSKFGARDLMEGVEWREVVDYLEYPFSYPENGENFYSAYS